MIDFTVETEIRRPVADVFEHVCDPGQLAGWQTNTVSAVQEGEGPFGLGTRLREVHRAPGGKQLASVVEVAEYEHPRVLALRVVEGTPVHARMTFAPTEHGTLVRFRAHGRLRGPLRLAQPLLQRTLRRQFTQHLANLRRVLEDAAARTAAGPPPPRRRVPTST
ncbi:MAG TPA: SRPBCC family protein [Solirubrobacteraceae bacterium]|jgi:uncharacterized protein YndB with AHSA1/START domain|nr:SRPBCC family protein [Solirubrobacteraceae bacterium]